MALLAARLADRDRLDVVFSILDAAVGLEGKFALRNVAGEVIDPLRWLNWIEDLAAADADDPLHSSEPGYQLQQALERIATLSCLGSVARSAPQSEMFEVPQLPDFRRAQCEEYIARIRHACRKLHISLGAEASFLLTPVITSATSAAEAVLSSFDNAGVQGVLALLRGESEGVPPNLQRVLGAQDRRSLSVDDIDTTSPPFATPRFTQDWIHRLWDWEDVRYEWTDSQAWERIPWWWYTDAPGQRSSDDAFLQCLAKARALVEERAGIKPPLPPLDAPYGVTWAHQIAALSPSPACGTARLTIHGKNFLQLRDSAVITIPTEEGCRIARTASWGDTEIEVILPSTATSGAVGFVDKGYFEAYQEWVDDQDRRHRQLLTLRCGMGRLVEPPPPLAVCAPDVGVNHVSTGLGVIDSFAANDRSRLVIHPNVSFRLSWFARNCSSVAIRRMSSGGPGLPGGGQAWVSTAPSGSITMAGFGAADDETATYELSAEGPCGARTAMVEVVPFHIPNLAVQNIEFTQGIQVSKGLAQLPLVAQKQTIARVSVTHDLEHLRLSRSDSVKVTGWLRIAGRILRPINIGDARLPGNLDRKVTNDTLNFRIPAGWAQGVADVHLTVWTVDDTEVPPGGLTVRPRVDFRTVVTWRQRPALKLRYVRISTPTSPAPSERQCYELLVRAHDLLPAPPDDIGPAWLSTWHTSLDLGTLDGRRTLLDHLDDQHDCTISEAVLPWEDDCPKDDGAIWVGIASGASAGAAQGFRLFNKSRNTLVTCLDHVVTAHEIGHTQGLGHGNRSLACGGHLPESPFDNLPAGGRIIPGDAFDPTLGEVVREGVSLIGTRDGDDLLNPRAEVGLWDMMTYACDRWVSPDTWVRLFDEWEA